MKNKAALIAALFLGLFIMSKSLNKQPRGIRNNNPGNIRISNSQWQGAVGDDGSFVTFKSPEWGVRAIARILRTYREKHGINTIAGIISRWAPTNENDTKSYINSVSRRVGILEFAPIDDIHIPDIIDAIIYHENGQQPYSAALINEGIALAWT